MINYSSSAQVLEAAETLALALEAQASLLVQQPTRFHLCLVGLAQLAYHHGLTLGQALAQENRPTLMVSARVLLEGVFNLDYILEKPEFREYRATLLLLEGVDRDLELLCCRFAPDHPRRAELQALFEAEKQALLLAIDYLDRAPSDPLRWKRRERLAGGSVAARARVGGWDYAYAMIYGRGSGYVHSDGYAIRDLRFPDRESDELLVGVLAKLVMLFVEELFNAFPELEEFPKLVSAWNQFGSKYCSPMGKVTESGDVSA